MPSILPKQTEVAGTVRDRTGHSHRLMRAVRALQCHGCARALPPGALCLRKAAHSQPAGNSSIGSHLLAPFCLSCSGCLEDTCEITKPPSPAGVSPASGASTTVRE